MPSLGFGTIVQVLTACLRTASKPENSPFIPSAYISITTARAKDEVVCVGTQAFELYVCTWTWHKYYCPFLTGNENDNLHAGGRYKSNLLH